MRISKDCKWKHPKAPAVGHTRPGQQWARAAMEVHAHLVARDNEVTVHWVLAHSGILSNDGFAKNVACSRQRHQALDELFGRPASHMPKWQWKTDRGLLPGGSQTMSGQSDDTGPQRVLGFEGGHWAG